MLTNIEIVDLTRYATFTYWPLRDMGDETLEKIQDPEDAKDAQIFAVFGKHWIPKEGEAEELVAEFTTLQECTAYCLMLNRGLRGRNEDFNT